MPASESPRPLRALLELAGLALGVTIVLVWATRPGSALASMYLLVLLASTSWGLARALGRPRLAQWVARLVLCQGLLLAWSASHPQPPLPELPRPRCDFPTPTARVWHELRSPAAWVQAAGEPWIYVGAIGAPPAGLLAAGPVLEVEGQRVEVTLDPWVPTAWLRGRFPRQLLGREVTISFGFERPTAELQVYPIPYYWGTVPRAPSSWSADGSRPPPGVPLPLRGVGPLGRLAGQSPYAVLAVRHAIELRLIDSRPPPPLPPGAARPRVLDGCY